jgi:hypothetical protein
MLAGRKGCWPARISGASFCVAKHPDLPAELRPWIDMTLAS